MYKLCILAQTTVSSVSATSGDTVTIECQPSVSCLGIYRMWTYLTVGGAGNLTTLEELNQSRFQDQPLLEQLILPVATVNDTGNYACIVRIELFR